MLAPASGPLGQERIGRRALGPGVRSTRQALHDLVTAGEIGNDPAETAAGISPPGELAMTAPQIGHVAGKRIPHRNLANGGRNKQAGIGVPTPGKAPKAPPPADMLAAFPNPNWVLA